MIIRHCMPFWDRHGSYHMGAMKFVLWAGSWAEVTQARRHPSQGSHQRVCNDWDRTVGALGGALIGGYC